MTYGFDHFPRAFPSQVIVDATEVCNLRCIHCPHPAFKQSEHYGARMLDPALCAKAMLEVGEHGAEYVRFTSNGEPLVHPHIYDMLDFAVQKSGTFVTLTTNGTTLVEKRLRRLMATGLHMVDVSIDAVHNATYEKVRGGNLDVTRENVLHLIEWAKGTNTTVVVSFVEQDANQDEAGDFVKFWREAGAHDVVIRRLHSAAGNAPNVIQVHRRSQQQNRYPCVYPWERITLNARGFLSFCPQDWGHGSEIADYRTTTIKETWDGPFYQRLREAHMSNDFSCHKFCGQCPDWAQTRWPGQGDSYRDLVARVKVQK